MRQMGMDFGDELRRQRMAAGLSLRDLAALVHYSRGYLSKVETRQASASIQLARLCDAALQAGGALMRLADPGPQEPMAVSDSPGVVLPTTAAKEADDCVGSGRSRADCVASATEFMQLPVPCQPNQSHMESIVGSFRDWFVQVRALGQQASPGVVLPTLVGQTHTLRDLARLSASQDSAAIYRLASMYAEYIGWMMQEAGEDDAALRWTAQAARLAAAGGDPAMGAYGLVRRALICLHRGDHQQTIHLSQLAMAEASASARVRGLAALREAQGHALAGTRERCYRALDRARSLLSLAKPEDGAHVLGVYTVPDPTAMITGWCLHDLGEPEEATVILDREIAGIPRDAYRSRCRYAARRALACATAGDVGRACQLTRELLPDAHDLASATIRVDLQRLARVLGRWPSNPAVRDIHAELTSVIAMGRPARKQRPRRAGRE
jgi:helix-turn-helix protein